MVWVYEVTFCVMCMETFMGMDVMLHMLLASLLDEGTSSASHLSSHNPKERASRTP